jgi:NADH:ubiquinone oxidoreductase subunit K
MLNKLFLCCLFLVILSLLGIMLNRKNIIITLICVEMMLLAVNLNFIIHSIYLDDILGQVYAFFIIALGAAESAMGLGILISFFRVRQSMTLNFVLLKH